jgi:hypothetical protein
MQIIPFFKPNIEEAEINEVVDTFVRLLKLARNSEV